MSMGAKASKDRAEGSSVVIVLGGGKREMYSRPMSAQEVMLQHPQHVLTHLDVLGSDFRKAIVTPETVLLPGNKYYLVPRRTLEWLLEHHTTLNRPNAGRRRTSDSATDPTHVDINLGHGLVDVISTRSDPIDASPQRSRAIIEHKPSIMFTEERLNPARRGNVKRKTAKSPSRSISWSENTQRSRRSSPKVCPGEDGGGSVETHSQGAAFDKSSPLLLLANGATSMQLELPSNQETPACNLVLPGSCNLAVADRVNTMSHREVDLAGHQRSQSLQEPVQEGQNMPLFEFLKCPDLNVGKLLEDKPQCQLTFTPRVENEVPVVQPVEVCEHIGVMLSEVERGTFDHALSRKAMVSCLDREDVQDVQQTQSQFHVFTKPSSQVDMIDKPHNMAQAYHKDEDGERSPPKENIKIEVLVFNTATCNDEGTSGFQQGNEDSSNISESLLVSVT